MRGQEILMRHGLRGTSFAGLASGSPAYRPLLIPLGLSPRAQGYWKYGDNLGAFNDAVANGDSLGSAARSTWTGQRAAEYGFTRVKVIQADEGADGFTTVSAIFRRE